MLAMLYVPKSSFNIEWVIIGHLHIKPYLASDLYQTAIIYRELSDNEYY